ncbi:MAG: hypothetical protein PHU24_04180 [Sphaerochaetaceae bacterium]|jgi:menaquinone-dependent protoporphyrinogen IX oxidase|nr:hypothetical protein [Sphaerochaetaceae bacterium]NLO61138.1 hypothetical protein [Spirochaetales bacterium]MDD2405638.1 hypothetical protein [Sphaerochaetaceae bacterium]MDD3670429.1 hypothetical protein [Sphaerochaetaceae bacterium]MDD4260423.1 hypothetical protein [Sphaerochaetaceae bacterium]
MRVCVLYCESSGTSCKELSAGLAEGLQMQGHTVDVIDMQADAGKIVSFYDYLVVGTSAISFWGGKIPRKVDDFLKAAGTISGKRCFAFVPKRGMRVMKTLQRLMHVMESQGMYLTYSDVLTNRAFAKEVGKRLKIS